MEDKNKKLGVIGDVSVWINSSGLLCHDTTKIKAREYRFAQSAMIDGHQESQVVLAIRACGQPSLYAWDTDGNYWKVYDYAAARRWEHVTTRQICDKLSLLVGTERSDRYTRRRLVDKKQCCARSQQKLQPTPVSVFYGIHKATELPFGLSHIDHNYTLTCDSIMRRFDSSDSNLFSELTSFHNWVQLALPTFGKSQYTAVADAVRLTKSDVRDAFNTPAVINKYREFILKPLAAYWGLTFLKDSSGNLYCQYDRSKDHDRNHDERRSRAILSMLALGQIDLAKALIHVLVQNNPNNQYFRHILKCVELTIKNRRVYLPPSEIDTGRFFDEPTKLPDQFQPMNLTFPSKPASALYSPYVPSAGGEFDLKEGLAPPSMTPTELMFFQPHGYPRQTSIRPERVQKTKQGDYVLIWPKGYLAQAIQFNDHVLFVLGIKREGNYKKIIKALGRPFDPTNGSDKCQAADTPCIYLNQQQYGTYLSWARQQHCITEPSGGTSLQQAIVDVTSEDQIVWSKAYSTKGHGGCKCVVLQYAKKQQKSTVIKIAQALKDRYGIEGCSRHDKVKCVQQSKCGKFWEIWLTNTEYSRLNMRLSCKDEIKRLCDEKQHQSKKTANQEDFFNTVLRIKLLSELMEHKQGELSIDISDVKPPQGGSVGTLLSYYKGSGDITIENNVMVIKNKEGAKKILNKTRSSFFFTTGTTTWGKVKKAAENHQWQASITT